MNSLSEFLSIYFLTFLLCLFLFVFLPLLFFCIFCQPCDCSNSNHQLSNYCVWIAFSFLLCSRKEIFPWEKISETRVAKVLSLRCSIYTKNFLMNCFFLKKEDMCSLPRGFWPLAEEARKNASNPLQIRSLWKPSQDKEMFSCQFYNQNSGPFWHIRQSELSREWMVLVLGGHSRILGKGSLYSWPALMTHDLWPWSMHPPPRAAERRAAPLSAQRKSGREALTSRPCP